MVRSRRRTPSWPARRAATARGAAKRNRRRRRGPLLPAIGRALAPVAGACARYALPALGTVVLAVAGLASFHYVATGPYFRVHRLEVAGLERLGEAEVMRIVGVTMGVTSTLDLDVDAVREAVEGHPWVASARVELTRPDRLRIEVTERHAAALVLLERPVLSDGFGHLFAVPTRPEDFDYPVVTGIEPAALRRDDDAAQARLRQALAAVREWTRQGLDALDGLSEVRPDPVLGLELVTSRDGTAVRVGHAELSGRLARLREVLEAVRARGKRADYVLLDDEREPGRAAVREVADPGAAAHGAPTARSEIARRSHGTQG